MYHQLLHRGLYVVAWQLTGSLEIHDIRSFLKKSDYGISVSWSPSPLGAHFILPNQRGIVKMHKDQWLLVARVVESVNDLIVLDDTPEDRAELERLWQLQYNPGATA